VFLWTNWGYSIDHEFMCIVYKALPPTLIVLARGGAMVHRSPTPQNYQPLNNEGEIVYQILKTIIKELQE